VIGKKGGHDFAFSIVNIILRDFEVRGHRVTDLLQGRAVIMLATLGRVWVGVDDKESRGKSRSDEI
jgi:hypothetical protein